MFDKAKRNIINIANFIFNLYAALSFLLKTVYMDICMYVFLANLYHNCCSLTLKLLTMIKFYRKSSLSHKNIVSRYLKNQTSYST